MPSEMVSGSFYCRKGRTYKCHMKMKFNVNLFPGRKYLCFKQVIADVNPVLLPNSN